ncbi:Uncharacterised protein [Mycobacteroides abscessus subsp. massiliense]|nr:Uncharacterised protein [Mycobacteroides abscessus subsp. massiliense]
MTTAYTNPAPPTASGISSAVPNTRDKIGNHTNGCESMNVRVMFTPSAPKSNNRAANRCPCAVAQRNDPLSVTKPAYRQWAISGVMSTRHASSSRATIIVVESASMST